jgi:hypothetical protein
MMSIAGVLAFLSQLVLGPFAGVWVDRLNRKAVIIAADLFIGLAALVFALFFLLGNPPYWSVCMVLGIRAVGNVFHSPAIQAAVPMLVPQQELVRANGRSQQQSVQHPIYRLYAGNHRPGTDGACFFPDRKPQFSDYAFGIAHSRPNCRK